MSVINNTLDRNPICDILADLAQFREFGTATTVERRVFRVEGGTGVSVPVFVNEFWTAKQRQANSLHEVSYRACFKPQLSKFFIERLTQPGETVHDPFMGRGTTCLEAALLGRAPWGSDVNPLSTMLIAPRLNPPTIEQVKQRLLEVDFNLVTDIPETLLVFYHPETLRHIISLRTHLKARQAEGTFDLLDNWIRMVALNRLTGHSPGFFSVYTLPPNQAVSLERQRKINAERNQVPEFRDVPGLILKKTRALLKDCNAGVLEVLREAGSRARLLTARADATPGIPDNSVALVVTSPPFLDVVDYEGDNWLRCWFAGIDPKSVHLTICPRVEDWQAEMTTVFRELHRVLKPGGHIAFEVGEVRGRTVTLEEAVIPAGVAAGLQPILVMINDQAFTKTANCWGVANNAKGTNTNRIVLFCKSA